MTHQSKSDGVAPVIDGGQQEAEELRQPSPPASAAEATVADALASSSSSSVNTAPHAPAENYSNPQMILDEADQGNVKLLKPELFIDYQKAGKPLPKCQDVPDEYVVHTKQLTAEERENLVVIAISYCWISPDHPDPNGYYLEVLAKLLSLFVEGKYEEEKEYDMGDGVETPADYLRDLGFHFGAGDGRPVGIFLDWPSVPQDKPHGSRTEAETAVFKDALKNINLWYAHSATITWMLTFLPEGAMRTDYGSSGWTFFEFCVGALLSHSCKLLRIDAGVREKLLEGSWDEDRTNGKSKWGSDIPHPGDYLQLSLDTMDTQRGPPLAPDRFNELVDAKTFTNGADADAIVKPQYLKAFKAVIADVDEVNYSGLPFDNSIAVGLIEAMRLHCKGVLRGGKLRRLSLKGSKGKLTVPLKEWALLSKQVGIEELDLEWCSGVWGKLSSANKALGLTVLNFEGCYGIRGDLANVSPLVNLTVLNLKWCKDVTGDLASIADLSHLKVLNLYACKGVRGDIKCVNRMKDLRKLNLYWCSGVSGTLSSITELSKLFTEFDIRFTRIFN